MLSLLAVLAFHGGGAGDGVHGPGEGAGDGDILMDPTATAMATTTRTATTAGMAQEVRGMVMGMATDMDTTTAMRVNIAPMRANIVLPLDRK